MKKAPPKRANLVVWSLLIAAAGLAAGCAAGGSSAVTPTGIAQSAKSGATTARATKTAPPAFLPDGERLQPLGFLHHHELRGAWARKAHDKPAIAAGCVTDDLVDATCEVAPGTSQSWSGGAGAPYTCFAGPIFCTGVGELCEITGGGVTSVDTPSLSISGSASMGGCGGEYSISFDVTAESDATGGSASTTGWWSYKDCTTLPMFGYVCIDGANSLGSVTAYVDYTATPSPSPSPAATDSPTPPSTASPSPAPTSSCPGGGEGNLHVRNATGTCGGSPPPTTAPASPTPPPSPTPTPPQADADLTGVMEDTTYYPGGGPPYPDTGGYVGSGTITTPVMGISRRKGAVRPNVTEHCSGQLVTLATHGSISYSANNITCTPGATVGTVSFQINYVDVNDQTIDVYATENQSYDCQSTSPCTTRLFTTTTPFNRSMIVSVTGEYYVNGPLPGVSNLNRNSYPYNYAGDFYPRIKPNGYTGGLVPWPAAPFFPCPGTAPLPPCTTRSQPTFIANTVAYYQSSGLGLPFPGTSPRNSGYQGHHIKPLSWGGDNSGPNGVFLTPGQHVPYTSWWLNFSEP